MSLTRQLYRRHPKASNDPKSGSTLSLLTEPIQIIEPTDILIEIHAVSLNYRDANIVNGTNPWAVKSDGIPCSDAAGNVVAIGPKVKNLKIGDRVSPILDQHSITGTEQTRQWLGGEVDGVLATYCVFPEETVVKIPEHLSWSEAACLPNAGLTAWNGLMGNGRGELKVGKTVLIQGTGGVSLMALKIARSAGCKVFLTSSSDEKLEKVRSECERVGGPPIRTVNYRANPEWDEEVVRLNGGRGVDIVIENGGAATMRRSMNATAKRGVVSSIGYLGKQDLADLEGVLPTLIDKTITLLGINVGSKLEFEQMNQAIAATQLRFEDFLDKTFSFEEAAEAIQYLWSGQHVGKIIVKVKS